MPDVTISYKGNSIATMSASGTKTLLTEGTYCEDDITVDYTVPTPAAGSATTPATTITANPTISVSSGGLITATASASQSITPTVVAGYVSAGTAGTVTVSGSNTQQMTTKGATTYTPTTTNQTIASGTYLTGTQTISGDANLVAENIKKDVVIFGVTGTASGGVENVVIEYHDDFGSVAKIWVAPNATVEDVVDIELGTAYKKITTPKQSLFVVGSIGMAPSPQSDIPCETVDNGSRASIRYWTAYFVGNSGAIIYY